MFIYVYIIYLCTCMGGGRFTKKYFHGENLRGGVAVHGRTYDQIMSREGELYECVLQ